ncbi:MAG TPA: hypothetical protein VIE65_04195 [Methylobacter sp.]
MDEKTKSESERENPWRDSNRLRKVIRLVATIDSLAETLGQPRPGGPWQAGVLRQASKEQWRELAGAAKVIPPSRETIEEVCRIIEKRTEPVQAEIPF